MDYDVVIIGAGPAGLMAAQALGRAGFAPALFDHMPSPARKFLRAGIGGLNITHSEPFDAFLSRYGAQAAILEPFLRRFGPQEVRDWARDLGIDTFVGSSGRVFPTDFKAAPLLRAWLKHLHSLGASLLTGHRWLGWDDDGRHVFQAGGQTRLIHADATILALGGASWARLGSDGAWTRFLPDHVPFRPANCGFDCDWSPHFKDRFAGHPVKSIGLTFGGRRLKGEFVVTETGVEGSAIYALSAPLRDAIAAQGQAVLSLDLKPDWSEEKLAAALAQPRGSRSLSNHLERHSGIRGVAAGLARETLSPDQLLDAAALKALPLIVRRPRPLDEAISCAGGLNFAALDDSLMLRRRPGTFAAGEMLDWEAPTGGYLLTACLSLGWAAGNAAAEWLKS